MKITHAILSAAALIAASTSVLNAQTAASKPVGVRTESLVTGFNLLGVNLAEPIVSSGTVTAVSGNNVTVTATDLTSLGTSDLLFKIVDGANAGVTLQCNQTGASTLALLNGGSSVTVGAKYELRRSSTVASLFGATNSAGLRAAGDLSSADNIYIPSTTGFSIVYYSDGTGFDTVGWKDSFGADASGLEIPYTTAIFIKNTTGPKTITFTGHVIPTNTKQTIVPNFNYISRVLPVNVSLDASGLKDQITQGGDLTSADNVYITSPTGYKICYYSNGTGFDPVGWISDSAPSGNLSLSSGYLIFRRGSTPTTINAIIPTNLDI